MRRQILLLSVILLVSLGLSAVAAGSAADLPDKGPATDCSNYGDAAGEKLTALLKEHLTTAAEIVAAARANDTAKMEDAKRDGSD